MLYLQYYFKIVVSQFKIFSFGLLAFPFTEVFRMSDKDSHKRNSKNSKKRRVSIIRILLVTIILIGFISAGATIGIAASVIKTAEPIDASNIYEILDQSSFILDSEGRVIEQIQSNNFRVIVDYAEMPKHLRGAFVAIEDERFWTHRA